MAHYPSLPPEASAYLRAFFEKSNLSTGVQIDEHFISPNSIALKGLKKFCSHLHSIFCTCNPAIIKEERYTRPGYAEKKECWVDYLLKIFFVDAQYTFPTPLDHDVWKAIHTSEKNNPNYFLKSNVNKLEDTKISPERNKKRKLNGFEMVNNNILAFGSFPTPVPLAFNDAVATQSIHSTIHNGTIPDHNSQTGPIHLTAPYAMGLPGISYQPYGYGTSIQLPSPANFSHMHPHSLGFPVTANNPPQMKESANRPLSLSEIEARVLHPSILNAPQRKRRRNDLSLVSLPVVGGNSKGEHKGIAKHSTGGTGSLKSQGKGSKLEEECIDLCLSNDDHISTKILLQMQKWEEGYPSKIARKAVEIKLEKNTLINPVGDNPEKNITNISENKPATPQEQAMINQLQQCGFESRDEILAALRHIISSNAYLGFDQIIENAITYIIGQREEAEEARKMDVARMESEFTILQEREQQKDSKMPSDYSIKDLLGGDGDTWTHSVAFPHSDLLKCFNIRTFFGSLFQIDAVERKCRTQVVELLNLELKARKWYGEKLPVAYFRFGLRDRLLNDWMNKKVQSTFTSGERDKAFQSIVMETNALKEAMYRLENQIPGDFGANVQKLFVDARKSAIKNGLMSDPTGRSGMIVIE